MVFDPFGTVPELFACKPGGRGSVVTCFCPNVARHNNMLNNYYVPPRNAFKK